MMPSGEVRVTVGNKALIITAKRAILSLGLRTQSVQFSCRQDGDPYNYCCINELHIA